MNRMTFPITLVVLVSILLLAGCAGVPVPVATTAAAASSFQHTTAEVRTHSARGEPQLVEGAWVELITDADAARATFATQELEPGHVYTWWWVIFNNPEACAASPCSPQDLLGNTEAVQGNVAYGGGGIAGENGALQLSSYLPAGEIVDGWFDAAFIDPRRAELHVVINSHGPVLDGMAGEMINTYRGGCTDESLPPPFPETAKADGAPGPNQCLLYQFAILQQ